MISLNLSKSQTLTALRGFLLSVLPSSVEVVQGLDNRVAEPAVTNFVTMTPILQERIETNTDTYVDAVFTGSITGTTMTISNVSYGSLLVGSQIFGVGLAANTIVTAFGTGTGGLGDYTISPSQNITNQKLAAGTKAVKHPEKVTVQLDVHGTSSYDNSQIIATLFRDSYAVDQFALSGFDVTPLYAGEPKQIPFLNGEQQIEERWSIDAVMQCNPVVTIPQEFADALSVTLNEVDAFAPPITRPSAPIMGTAIAGIGQAYIYFSPPISDGGNSIIGYLITASNGQTITGLSSPILFTGLTNGASYTFTAIAYNSIGYSVPSAASNLITLAFVPSAPTIGTATGGNAQASITFTPPISDGGMPITGYTVTSSGGQTATGTSSPIVVTGLVNGTSYTFTVHATNAVGNSVESSATNAVTPATVPNAPTIGTATAGSGSASVTFTPPAFNGGSAITGYTVTSTPSGLTATGASSPLVVTGLVNGVSYTFTAHATNAVGSGAESAASNAIVPLSTFGSLTNATYTGKSLLVSAQSNAPFNVVFKTDGLSMYMADGQNHAVRQYALSTAFDISTATYSKTSGNIYSATADGLSAVVVYGVDISADGTQIYVYGTYNSNPTVFQFALSTAWDISTRSAYATKMAEIYPPANQAFGVTFSADGTKMYCTSNLDKKVYQFNLSVAWDVSTAAYANKFVLIGAVGVTANYGVDFSADGLRMYFADEVAHTVYRWVLSTAWDISTATASQSHSVNSQDAVPRGVCVNVAENLIYVTGVATLKIYEYSMP